MLGGRVLARAAGGWELTELGAQAVRVAEQVEAAIGAAIFGRRHQAELRRIDCKANEGSGAGSTHREAPNQGFKPMGVPFQFPVEVMAASGWPGAAPGVFGLSGA